MGLGEVKLLVLKVSVLCSYVLCVLPKQMMDG